MPYPAQTNRDAIIEMAQTLIERDGVEQLSLAQLAAALHIKAPSLYRHVTNKTDLLRAVIERTFTHLFNAYASSTLSAETTDPITQIRLILNAHRAFAHTHPALYILAFTTTAPAERPAADDLEQMALPIQRVMATITGEEAALPALRGALALVHGFVMLELHQQLRRGGDLDAAFSIALNAYLAGWQS